MLRVSVKGRLRERGFVAGVFVETRSPEAVECLGLAGFDFCIIDREHGDYSPEATTDLMRAATLAGVAPLVRVRRNEPGEILEALDLGAVGLHVPQIASPEEAARAVSAARFPPAGERGFNPFVRAANYGATAAVEFRRQADEDTLLVLHIEGAKALAEVDAILATPGVDVAFLGPYDLSQTIGLPGEVTHPRVREALRKVVEAGRTHGVAVGCFANDLDLAAVWIAEGVSYLAYSVDTQLFLRAATAARDGLDRLLEARR